MADATDNLKTQVSVAGVRGYVGAFGRMERATEKTSRQTAGFGKSALALGASMVTATAAIGFATIAARKLAVAVSQAVKLSLEQEKVEATPFTTASGKEMRGGYYPLKFDPDLAQRVGEWTERDDLLNASGAMFPSTRARDGFTKRRVDSGQLALHPYGE